MLGFGPALPLPAVPNLNPVRDNGLGSGDLSRAVLLVCGLVLGRRDELAGWKGDADGGGGRTMNWLNVEPNVELNVSPFERVELENVLELQFEIAWAWR